MKKEILLAVYINVDNLSSDDVPQYIEQIKQKISTTKFDTLTVHFFWIPVTDQNTHIECIYPKFVLFDDLKNDIDVQQETIKIILNKLNDSISSEAK